MGSFFNADEVFEMAMDIEKSGEAYYRKAAGRMENPKVKDLMDYLADEEQKHHQVFAELRGSLPEKLTVRSMPDPENQERLYLGALVKSRLFTGDQEAERVAASMDGELEALKTALDFEKDTILFFIAMKDMTDEKLGREKIDLLINEEHAHVVKISKEIDKLT